MASDNSTQDLLKERLGADSAQGDSARGGEMKYGMIMSAITQPKFLLGVVAGRGFLMPGVLMLRFILDRDTSPINDSGFLRSENRYLNSLFCFVASDDTI